LTINDWADHPFCYCKPVAKTPGDLAALLKAAVSGNAKKIFFLGTDNAPRPAIAKRGGPDGKAKTAAGVFTQPYATQLVLGAVEEGINQGVLKEEKVTKEILVGFLGVNGRRFYKEPATYSPARRECHAFSYIIRWQH